MLRRSALLALAIGALAACDHGSPVGPEVQPGPSPVVRLDVVKSAQVFTGRGVPARAFVFRAYDATGAIVANPRLAYSGGWVSHDTLYAPNVESRGVLRIAALNGRAQGVGPSLAASMASDTVTAIDSVPLIAALDLRSAQWTASWSCVVKDGRYVRGSDLMPVDSQYFDGLVDTVAYKDSAGFVNSYSFNGQAIAQILWTGNVVNFYRDGSRDTVALHFPAASIMAQKVDTLVLYSPNWEESDPVNLLLHNAVLTDSLPRTYTSRGWCPGTYQFSEIRPTVLREVVLP